MWKGRVVSSPDMKVWWKKIQKEKSETMKSLGRKKGLEIAVGRKGKSPRRHHVKETVKKFTKFKKASFRYRRNLYRKP